MVPANYLHTARKLLSGHRGRPRQSDLRKAISAAYYAVFYALCQNSADCFIGTPGADRSAPAWRQVFRAIAHGFAARRCKNQDAMERFPPQIQAFADYFVELQEKRHEADYNPEIRFNLDESQSCLDTAALAITELANASLKDRRAFAAWVTVRDRP